jgi:peptide/nickel transport system ATP-binding protein
MEANKERGQLLAATDEILVEVKNLKTHFFLTEGIVLGVVGESGCGKSVTARSIMNMIRPPGKTIGGQVTYHRRQDRRSSSASRLTGSGLTEEVEILQLAPMSEEMRSIRGGEFAMIFQEPRASLSPVHTIGTQLMEGMRLHLGMSDAEARRYAIEMLDQVNIPKPQERIDSYPHQLSGGMCQRAMIALALSCHPALLIADEPTTALDVTTEAQILDLMRELQLQHGTAIMYITHNLGVVAEIAKNVMVMYMGKDVELASVDAIFYDARHPYTQALLRSLPRINVEQETLAVMRGSVPDPYALPKGCPFHPRCHSRRAICSQDAEVPYVTVAPGHRVRCHLYA